MNKLLLLSGNDIPFLGARVTIHQPTIKEIAYIGEHQFFIGCGFLDFSKQLLNSQDKNSLENYNDFDIFMSIMMNGNKPEVRSTVYAARAVLDLIFPLYRVEVRNSLIVLTRDDVEYTINRENFTEFKQILSEMFSLSLGEKEKYNPSGDMAAKIAEKLNKRHAQLAKLSGQSVNSKDISILNRYVSIIAVGVQKSLNDLMQYTVYQLYDEFQRYQLKVQWDAYVSAKMAGAQNLEEVDNWMIDLSEQGKQKNKNKK